MIAEARCRAVHGCQTHLPWLGRHCPVQTHSIAAECGVRCAMAANLLILACVVRLICPAITAQCCRLPVRRKVRHGCREKADARLTSLSTLHLFLNPPYPLALTVADDVIRFPAKVDRQNRDATVSAAAFAVSVPLTGGTGPSRIPCRRCELYNLECAYADAPQRSLKRKAQGDSTPTAAEHSLGPRPAAIPVDIAQTILQRCAAPSVDVFMLSAMQTGRADCTHCQH